MLHIYTGDGKGKTTAAEGLALRAAAQGLKVLFFQFMKSDDGAERTILTGIDAITVISIGETIPFMFNIADEEKEHYKTLYKSKIDMIYNISGLFDVFIFDEAVCAINSGLIDAEDILRFKKNGEVVITGRGDISGLEEYADYITNMSKIKHPYDLGIEARKGIEY